MKTPPVTLKQYAILNLLCPSAWGRIILTDEQNRELKWHSGADLRKRLKWSASLPAFYQVILTLETQKMIRKRRSPKKPEIGARECEYCITPKGKRACQQVDDFVDYFGRVIHQGF